MLAFCKSGSSSNEAYGVPDNLVQQVWSSPQLRSTIPSVLNAFKSVYPAMAQELIQVSDPANKQYIWSRCTSRDSDDNVQLLLARTDVLSVDSSHLVCVKKFVDYSCVLMIWAELVVEYNETELLCAEASSMFNSSDAQSALQQLANVNSAADSCHKSTRKNVGLLTA